MAQLIVDRVADHLRSAGIEPVDASVVPVGTRYDGYRDFAISDDELREDLIRLGLKVLVPVGKKLLDRIIDKVGGKGSKHK